MKIFIAILVSSLAILVNSSPFPYCGGNQTFSSCENRCKEPTCASLSFNIADTCSSEDCVRGCFCKEGYARIDHDACVKIADCALKTDCDCNEVLSKCASECGDPSCNEPNVSYCSDVCQTRCVCKSGFIRNRMGVCIAKSTCPTGDCKKNEIFKACVTPCNQEQSCERINHRDTNCENNCTNGCFCKRGYLRDIDDKCVRVTKCQNNNCNRKTEDYRCGNDACTPACGEEIDEICKHVRLACDMGCFCKSGFIRDSSGKCISQKKCDASLNKCN